MAAKVRYVRIRDGVYQYERRVPLSVQRKTQQFATLFGSKPLFRRSLQTKQQTEMFEVAGKVHAEFESLVAQATGRHFHPAVAVKNPLKKVTETDLQSLVERYRQLTRAPFEQALLKADIDKASAQEAKRLEYELGLDAERLRQVVEERGAYQDDPSSPYGTAMFVVEREGFDAPPNSTAFASIVNAIRSGMLHGYSDVDGLISGKLLPQPPKAKAPADAKAGLSLRQAVKLYLEHRKLPNKTVSEVNLSLRTFEAVIGNKSIEALQRADFIQFVEHLSNQSVGGKTAGSVQRNLNEATIKKRLGFLRSAIGHAIDRHLFDGVNPAREIKVEAWAKKPDPTMLPDKRRFDVGELNKIFEHPWFTGCLSPKRSHEPGNHRLTGSEFWVPIVALMTGCRASELGGLKLAEVKLDDPHPHLVIRDNEYRRTKGGYERRVPILDALLEIGFGDYYQRIASSDADRLFPDWVSPKRHGIFSKEDAAWANGRIIRAFNRSVVPSMLRDAFLDGARQPVTFHSLRGAFKGMLGHPDYKLHPNIINEVMGHKKSDLDARYVGTIPVEETYEAIHRCRFKSLKMPSAP